LLPAFGSHFSDFRYPQRLVGGAFDLIYPAVLDAVLSIPSLLLLMVVISLIGRVCGKSSFAWDFQRHRRFQNDTEPGNRYQIQSVRSSSGLGGRPTWKILVQHILPNIMAPIIIIFSMTVPSVILAEAG